ncbi:MAG: fibronectin type III domain-containing protein [Bacteroidota bacterium]|nr:fibronectin type III domain-containing protein [Bacteroidota bacterium]
MVLFWILSVCVYAQYLIAGGGAAPVCTPDNTRTIAAARVAQGPSLRLPRSERLLLGTRCLLPGPRSSAPRLHPPGGNAGGQTRFLHPTPYSPLSTPNSSIRFTENRGQFIDADGRRHPEILFKADVPGAQLYLRLDGISTVFTRTSGEADWDADPFLSRSDRTEAGETVTVETYRLDMTLAGCNPAARVRGEEQLDGVVNYYLPQCPDGLLGVREYRRVVYEEVYDKIDLELFSSGGLMKYNFVVRPGGRPEDIRMRYESGGDVSLLGDGGLSVTTPLGAIEEAAPACWTEGDHRPVQTRFVRDGATVGFRTDSYDGGRTLVIDPWATYYGGERNGGGADVAVDASGNVVMAGTTESATNIATPGAHQTTFGLGGPTGPYLSDAFLVKFDADGTRLWATYYGGETQDVGEGVAVDILGNIYLCGRTASTTGIATAGAHLTTYEPMTIGTFLVKFDANGIRQWGTYYHGSNPIVAIDPGGYVYMAGGFVKAIHDCATPGAHQVTFGGGGNDGFIVKFDANGVRQWGTFYGGNDDEVCCSIAVDAGGNVYVCGYTWSPDNIATPGAHQTSYKKWRDGFLVKFNSSGVRQWGTYYGGEDEDWANSVVTGPGGAVYLGGATGSLSGLATSGGHQVTQAGSLDAFLVKFDADGVRQWATYYGGENEDDGESVAVDAAGAVYIAGRTASFSGIATLGTYQSAIGGDHDAFIAKFSPAGVRQLGTYFGGKLYEELGGLAVDPNGSTYICGSTRSKSGIATPGAYQTSMLSSESAYLAKFESLLSAPPPAPSGLTATALGGTRVHLAWEDNSSTETCFIIEQKYGASPWAAVDTVRFNTTDVLLTGRKPQTAYSFRVLAMYFTVASAYSNTADATTGPFPAPSGLAATATGNSGADLTWKDNSGSEEGFILELAVPPGSWTAVDTVGENAEHVAVAGLQPDTRYEFRVMAYDGQVRSAYSNTADVKTKMFLAAPTAFQAEVLSATQARLTWTDNATGETGYEVWQRLAGGAWSQAATAAANATLHVCTGLAPDSTYVLRVRAVGDDAASDWSAEQTVVMAFHPDAPTSLSATAVDYRSVRLNWKQGSANEQYYEIERQTQGGAWAAAKTAARGVTTVLDEGLADQTTYSYRVRAVNGAGASDWSNEASATTPALPVPGRPFGLSATLTGPFSIRLAWLQPEPAVEAGFEIEESLTDRETDFRKVSPDAGPGARSYDRTGLQPSTIYYYRIRAVNKSGASGYSPIVSATTGTASPTPPGPPRMLTAAPQSTTSIRLSWEIPDTTFVESYDLERSLTSDQGGFARIAGPIASDRGFSDTGLAINTTYWYRIRAANRYGESAWSNTASAKTLDITVTPEMLAAMDAKDTLIGRLEALIPEGSADMAALRGLLGDHARGYDETAAIGLIASWKKTGSAEPEKAAEAMHRYALAEQALLVAWGNDADFPGAKEMAREAVLAPALCAKNLGALALLWKLERVKIAQEKLPLYDAVMDDLAFAALDGEKTLSAMTGAKGAAGSATLYAEAVRRSGDVADLTSGMLISVLPYYQQKYLAEDYIPATEQMIATFADRTWRVDIAGSYDSAAVKTTRHVDAAKSTTTALKTDFTAYGNGLTDLDAAYAISSSGNVEFGPFLRKMVNLRPRLIDNVRKAILGGETPLTRAAYLTSASPLPGIGSLPSEINSAAEAAFDPVTNNADGSGNIFRTLSKSGPFERTADQAALDADRTLLLELRSKVIEKDTGYINARFHVLRGSGRGAVAELSRRARPLEGILPSRLVVDGPLLGGVLDALAKANRARALRTVLSAALADYLVDPQESKNAPLVAEIDTILGCFDQAAAALTDIGPAAALKITEPVLSLGDASLLPLSPSSPPVYRLRFTVLNAGGADAQSVTAQITPLDSNVSPVSPSPSHFTMGDMAKGVARADSMDMQIPAGTETVTFAVEMTIEKGRSFTDHVTLAVPAGPTGIETAVPPPGVITLAQNYPNPFNPATTIEYSIPKPMVVRLVITNALGMEIARLVENEYRLAGMHSACFDASSLPSGVYIYRLEAGGAVLARRMAVVK